MIKTVQDHFCPGCFTSSLGERQHLVDVRLCVGPVDLHCHKLLLGGGRRPEGGLGQGHRLREKQGRNRRSRKWRRWRGRGGRGGRFGGSVGRLDPGEGTDVVLGDGGQVSGRYFLLGHFLLDGSVVLGGVASWRRRRARGREVQPGLGGFGGRALDESVPPTRAPLRPRRGRRLEGGGQLCCGGLNVILKRDDIFTITVANRENAKTHRHGAGRAASGSDH